jgi:hypothetical protein
MNNPPHEFLAQCGGSSPTSTSLQARGSRPNTADAKATKLRWKTSQNGNSYLSFYGLKVTLFANARRGGWTVSIGRNAERPSYSNHATEVQARAAAEQEFIRLKSSGQFKPPPGPTLRELLKGVRSLAELGAPGHEQYVERTGYLVREGDKADLIRFCRGDGNSTCYWVPYSQHKVVCVGDDGSRTMIATKWWWKQAEPAKGGW